MFKAIGTTLLFFIVSGPSLAQAAPANNKAAVKAPASVNAVTATPGASQMTFDTKAFLKQPANIAVQAGPALYDGFVNDGVEATTDVGIAIGLNTELKINSILYFQPELMYVRKGPTVGNVVFSRNYLEMPLLFKLKTENTYKSVRPYAFAGPNLGVHLGSSARSTTLATGEESVTTTRDLDSESNFIDFSADFGVGAEKKFSEKVSGFATFRVSMGLIDTINTAQDKLQNYGTQLLLGARYSL